MRPTDNLEVCEVEEQSATDSCAAGVEQSLSQVLNRLGRVMYVDAVVVGGAFAQ